MDKEVTTLGIRVVGDEESLGDFACTFLAVSRRSVKIFEDLHTLAAGSGTHIESGVTGLNVKEERWDHRDCLLA
jgi:hypothetical protein